MKKRFISHQTTVHENEKPFKCEFCQHRFGEINMLNKHQRFVHENKKLIHLKDMDL